jgi:hypothetical protein
MQNNTPNRSRNSNVDPFGFNPIVYETPRVMKFYERNHLTLNNTPIENKKKNIIFSLINSPLDPISANTRRLLLMKNNMDPLTEFSETHYMPIEGGKYKIPDGSGYKSKYSTNSSSHRKHIDVNGSFEIFQQSKDMLKTTMIGDGSGGHLGDFNLASHSKDDGDKPMKKKSSEEALRDITNKMNSSKNACEIRKRKRKSNQQLKILKWEFEKEGFWNKDKILNVAKITGLSESQVYKWCWDQKKKKTDDGKEEGKETPSSDDDMASNKENVPPGEDSDMENDENLNAISDLFNLSKGSKSITKLKKINRALMPVKSIQKLKMRALNQSHYNPIKFESVNKKIDFSNE